MTFTPSPRQLEAIEAKLGPVVVLAGPGAGKTFCLIQRIHRLIAHHDIPPERICVFTFTNKAADEIANRLESDLGERAEKITRGTIHAFCAALLREFGAEVGLARGFGIADDDYQRAVLRRLHVPSKWHGNMLTRFGLHRFTGAALQHKDQVLFERYCRFLEKRQLADFDTLVLKTAELLETRPQIADEIAGRWQCVLVDEFQDLNPVQYGIIKRLARSHGNIFAVGDDEQSIYSWTGATPELFQNLLNDFSMTDWVLLDENRRCPREVFRLARKLVTINPTLFEQKGEVRADRESPFAVVARGFPDDKTEAEWLIADLARDRAASGLAWGDYAVLYRRHTIGDSLEGSFLQAGMPCRMAVGRAITDDPVVSYVIAAVKVIANPEDPIRAEHYVRIVLPKPLNDRLRAEAEAKGAKLLKWMRQYEKSLPHAHEDGRKIRRAFYALQNLPALGKRQPRLTGLIEELLSQRVGEYRNALEERADEVTDPGSHPNVVALADRLTEALKKRVLVAVPRMGGSEIGLKGMLNGAGFGDVTFTTDVVPPPRGAFLLRPGEVPELGLALGLFKALQLVATRAFGDAFRDFVAVDLETTDKDIESAEIVEIGAVRVRGGEIVAEVGEIVRPRVPISAKAQEKHGISPALVAAAPFFESVWPRFRAFCGDDVMVAHNGYQFDFPIMKRMSAAIGDSVKFVTYDTLPLARELHPGSRSLPDLAAAFKVDAGESHRAVDDTRTLAKVFGHLQAAKLARARKTSLVNLLDHLGVALALSDPETLGDEAKAFREISRGFALGRYSECLEFYRAHWALDPAKTAATTEELIERLGGVALMLKIRAERGPDQRYPIAMARLRRLLGGVEEGPLEEQISSFLDRVALSARAPGEDVDSARVNLLTLHSTKGLEFSRVYVVGVEDAELPGGSQAKEVPKTELEEGRRLLYVGMTRTKDRLVLTYTEKRGEKLSGGHRFLDEMGLGLGPGA
ncbi:MAG: UvrD-helicase domain-containing protein [Gemmatimonadota bacterium]